MNIKIIHLIIHLKVNLQVVNTFAIFNGADMSPLTVVKEIEALQEVDSFEDTALLNALLPIETSGNELYEFDKYEGNTTDLEEEFTHDFEFLPLSQTQREIIQSTRSRPMTLVRALLEQEKATLLLL